MDLHIAFLYPDLMNIYGDRGNIIALQRRAEWRGIHVEVHDLTLGDALDPARDDFYFFGGGQDRQQIAVAHDLQGRKGAQLKEAVEGGAVVLSVCGGYQLLGHYYRPGDSDDLPGIGLFDLHTVAGNKRFIGNVVIETDFVGQLVGFENHSGLTYLARAVGRSARASSAPATTAQDGREGARYKTAYGCYLHGSLLPKNPRFTDYLLAQALARRHGPVALPPLDDVLEAGAQANAVERAHATR